MNNQSEHNVNYYDSRENTNAHINMVRKNLQIIIDELTERGLQHDHSKLESVEKPIFDKYTPDLNSLEYGTDEYKQSLENLGTALKHHYKINSHHPEHFENGMCGMTIVDLVELFCDWCASTMRHDTGDIQKSIKINKERFGYDSVLENIMINTAKKYKMGANIKD